MGQRKGEFYSSDFVRKKGCFFFFPQKLSWRNSPSAFLTLSSSREFFATENEARRLETAQGLIWADCLRGGFSREDGGGSCSPQRGPKQIPGSQTEPVRYPTPTPRCLLFLQKRHSLKNWKTILLGFYVCTCPCPRAKRLTIYQFKHTSFARKTPKGTHIKALTSHTKNRPAIFTEVL